MTTKEWLIRELENINATKGIEEGHLEADRLLIAYINDEDIKRAYEAMPKWYA